MEQLEIPHLAAIIGVLYLALRIIDTMVKVIGDMAKRHMPKSVAEKLDAAETDRLRDMHTVICNFDDTGAPRAFCKPAILKMQEKTAEHLDSLARHMESTSKCIERIENRLDTKRGGG